MTWHDRALPGVPQLPTCGTPAHGLAQRGTIWHDRPITVRVLQDPSHTCPSSAENPRFRRDRQFAAGECATECAIGVTTRGHRVARPGRARSAANREVGPARSGCAFGGTERRGRVRSGGTPWHTVARSGMAEAPNESCEGSCQILQDPTWTSGTPRRRVRGRRGQRARPGIGLPAFPWRPLAGTCGARLSSDPQFYELRRHLLLRGLRGPCRGGAAVGRSPCPSPSGAGAAPMGAAFGRFARLSRGR